MGWKTLKERFWIKHIVQISDGRICIGSGYVHDLAAVDMKTGRAVSNKTFSDFLSKDCPELAAANPAAILDAINAQDEFSASIPVFTYDGPVIIEKQCEEIGWPNLTHDGCIMYENTFSTDRDQVVRWALQNMRLGVKYGRESVLRIEQELAEAKERLASEEAGVAQLEREHPVIATEAHE